MKVTHKGTRQTCPATTGGYPRTGFQTPARLKALSQLCFYNDCTQESNSLALFVRKHLFLPPPDRRNFSFAKGNINTASRSRADVELFPDTALPGLPRRAPRHPFI